MASLELDPRSKRYRLRFRFGGRACKRQDEDDTLANAVIDHRVARQNRALSCS